MTNWLEWPGWLIVIGVAGMTDRLERLDWLTGTAGMIHDWRIGMAGTDWWKQLGWPCADWNGWDDGQRAESLLLVLERNRADYIYSIPGCTNFISLGKIWSHKGAWISLTNSTIPRLFPDLDIASRLLICFFYSCWKCVLMDTCIIDNGPHNLQFSSISYYFGQIFAEFQCFLGMHVPWNIRNLHQIQYLLITI